MVFFLILTLGGTSLLLAAAAEKARGREILILALGGTSLLLVLSIYPGSLYYLSLLAAFTSCLWLPVVVFFGVFYLLGLATKGRDGKEDKPGDSPTDEFAGVAEPLASHHRRMTIAWAVVALNLAMLALNVPRRVAFAVSLPFFNVSLPGANGSGPATGGWYGFYHVDRAEADPRGGVYFRTLIAPAGGPDGIHCGFAYRPNPVGSPFGSGGYSCSPLFGPWYSFEGKD